MIRSSSRVSWKEVALQAALLCALLAALFPRTFFRGEQISSGDILFALPHWDLYQPEGWTYPQNKLIFDHIFFLRPNYLESQQAVLNGEWPLWNPLQLAGMPLLANFQTSVFYPPRLLQLVMDIDTAMTAYVLLKLLLCGLSAYLAARLLLFSVPIARFFSVAWMLGSYNLLWCHWPLTDVAAWVPLLFTGVELTLQGRYRRGFFLMVPAGALFLLPGHPETSFTFGLGLGGYFLMRLLLERPRGGRLWKPVLTCTAAWAVILLVCAAQLIPFAEYVIHSTNAMARNPEAGGETYTPGIVAAFWAPRLFGTWAEDNFWAGKNVNSNLVAMLYPGMAVWFGAMFLCARTPHAPHRAQRCAMAAALIPPALFGLFLSFHLPALSFVHHIPLFDELREWYHSCFACFAFPLLAAIGLERWFAQPRRLRELLWSLPVVAAGASVLLFLLWFNARYLRMAGHWEYARREAVIAGVLALCALVPFALSCLRRKPGPLLLLLTIIVAVDYGVVTRGLRPSLPSAQTFPETELMRYLRDKPGPCRLSVAEGYIPSGTVANYGLEEWLGYDGIYAERIKTFQFTLGTDVWQAMEPVYGVDYYLNYPKFEPMLKFEEKDFLQLETVVDDMEIYRNTRAFPRAFLVGRLREVADTDAIFEEMLDPAYDPAAMVLTDRAPLGPLPDTDSAGLGAAEVLVRDSTRVVVEVEAARDAVLVLADAYYPGWNATVDGQAEEVFPAYYAFRGVLVPAGRHTVEFSYFPWSLRLGLLISGATLLAGAAAAYRELRRRPRKGAA